MAGKLLAEVFLESRIYPDCLSVHVIPRSDCVSCQARGALAELRRVLSALRSDLAQAEEWLQITDEARAAEDMKSIMLASPEGRPFSAYVNMARIKPETLDALGRMADAAAKAYEAGELPGVPRALPDTD